MSAALSEMDKPHVLYLERSHPRASMSPCAQEYVVIHSAYGCDLLQ